MLQGLVVRQNGKSAAIEELVEVFWQKRRPIDQVQSDGLACAVYNALS